ncbi:MAG TPA: hypothetical protein VGM90_41510 [Kofleriaceae bacterium]
MNRLALGQLLDTMTPAQEQTVTARVRLSDIEAAHAEELALDNAATTPMPRKSDAPARPVSHVAALLPAVSVSSPSPLRAPRKQTLRMRMHPEEATPMSEVRHEELARAISDARVETPMLALGTGVAISVPAPPPSVPTRELEGMVVSVAVAAIVLVAFFAVYLCI